VSPTPAAAPPAAEEIPPKADRPAEPEEEKVANDSKAEVKSHPIRDKPLLMVPFNITWELLASNPTLSPYILSFA
jgi:hypothetical protein